jgi:hypothetical protein
MPRGKDIANWEGLVLPAVKEQLVDFDNQSIVPTLRGMYYTLVNLKVLPKTQAAYHSFSTATRRCRENGMLSINCFADHTRKVINDFNDRYETIDDYIYTGIYYLENSKHDYKVPRWYDQPNHIEIWLEKDAAVETFRSIVSGLDVYVAPNRGNSSVAFFNTNVERLKRKQRREGKKLRVRYFGDADPSGEMMDGVYKRKFEKYGLYNVDFKRLAVTKEQIDRFELLTDPDPDTLDKLKRDSNRFKFMEKYGLASEEDLFSVELEAMQTQVRGYLKNLVQSEINSLFDPDRYRRVLAEKMPTPEKIDELVLSQLKDLMRRIKSN